jgi:hypothetical protein
MSTGLCIRNETSGVKPYEVPPSCHPGEAYQRTKGYVKIAGDMCTVSNDDRFQPDKIPCPVAYVTLLIILLHLVKEICSIFPKRKHVMVHSVRYLYFF